MAILDLIADVYMQVKKPALRAAERYSSLETLNLTDVGYG